MENEEKSHQWNLAYFGLAAVILGAIIGFGSSWYIWHLQQNEIDEEKLLERQNIATALYFDVSNIENKFVSSMQEFSSYTNNDKDVFNNTNFIYYTNDKYYSIDWIYNTFGKDISGFDSYTSTDLYAFYTNAAEINDLMQIVYQISTRIENGEQMSPVDIATAHTYSKGLFEIKIPEGIQLARKIKQELRQKYHINIALAPTRPNNRVNTSVSLHINHTNNSRSLAIDYH